MEGIELASESDEPTSYHLPSKSGTPALADVLEDDEEMPSSAVSNTDTDPTVLKLDRNYEYTIWLSYAEVYNEKVYDLLDSVNEGSGIPRPNSVVTRRALQLKACPPSDGDEATSPGKYIHDLRQFRVSSAAEAKSVIRLGQLHRRVFGTLANRQSSRSHGMVIIKIVRGHRGERNVSTFLFE